MEEQTLNEVLKELQENTKNPELIKDNKFYFKYKEIWHRVKMPNQKELTEADRCRNQTRIQLLQRGKKEGFLLKKDLITLLKENDIDIAKMDEEISKLKKEFVQIHLTASKKKDHEVEILKKLEEQASVFEKKIRKIQDERAEHLSPAIEYQAEDAWYKSLVASCTEKQIDSKEDKWKKAWKDFEDFTQDDSSLTYLAEAHLATLIQNG